MLKQHAKLKTIAKVTCSLKMTTTSQRTTTSSITKCEEGGLATAYTPGHRFNKDRKS